MRVSAVLLVVGLLTGACGGNESAETVPVTPSSTTTTSTVPPTTTTEPPPPVFEPRSLGEADFPFVGSMTLTLESPEVAPLIVDVTVESDTDALHVIRVIGSNLAEAYVVDGVTYSSDNSGPFLEESTLRLRDMMSDIGLFIIGSDVPVTHTGERTYSGVTTQRWEGGADTVESILFTDEGVANNSSSVFWLDEEGTLMGFEIDHYSNDGTKATYEWAITEIGDVTIEPPAGLPEPTGVPTTQANLLDVTASFMVFYTDNGHFWATVPELQVFTPDIPIVDPDELEFGSVTVKNFDEQFVIVAVALDGSYWCHYRNVDGTVGYGEGTSYVAVDDAEDCSAEAWSIG